LTGATPGVDPVAGIDLFPIMPPAVFFLPSNSTPQAHSFRASGPAQDRAAFGHLTVSAIALRATAGRRRMAALGKARGIFSSSP